MPRNKALKLIIDTNLWISFVISKKLTVLDDLLYTKNATLVFCPELIEELQSTISKPKLKKYFGKDALDEMLIVFEPFIEFVKIRSDVKICRDSKDDFLLALAKDSKADYLITGDNDLLTIGYFEKTKILTFSEFINVNNR